MTYEDISPLVSAALQAAHLHGATVHLTELARLLPENTTAEEVTAALESFPHLQGKYVVRDGLVLPASGLGLTPWAWEETRYRSLSNISAARAFASRLGNREVGIVAVSGSNSYLSASERDDLDLFCVTHEGKMWLFLLRALLMTRFLRLIDRRTPLVTFSCVMDWKYAGELFSKDKGALFARDALMARVVSGIDSYGSLIKQASWMRNYFPKLYRHQMAERTQRPPTEDVVPGLGRALNMFLYLVLGSFIRMKASVHNHLLARQGRDSALFHLRMGPNHLIYESRRYLALRSMYSNVAPIQPTPKDLEATRERISI